MEVLDVEKIINATPQKRLINAYNSMKKNYNEATAQEYLNAYKDGSLSFLFENSRMIFSEPYFGFDFYKEAVTDLSLCHLTVLENEKEKVVNYRYFQVMSVLPAQGDNMISVLFKPNE